MRKASDEVLLLGWSWGVKECRGAYVGVWGEQWRSSSVEWAAKRSVKCLLPSPPRSRKARALHTNFWKPTLIKLKLKIDELNVKLDENWLQISNNLEKRICIQLSMMWFNSSYGDFERVRCTVCTPLLHQIALDCTPATSLSHDSSILQLAPGGERLPPLPHSPGFAAIQHTR